MSSDKFAGRYRGKLSAPILRVAGLVISVFVLLHFVDVSKVAQQLFQLPFWAVVVAVIVCLFRIWLTGVRWQLLNPNRSISQWRYFQYMMIGSTFNIFMVGSLGGDFARAIMIYRNEAQNRATHVLSIWVDRIIGLISILILGLVFSFVDFSAVGHKQYFVLNGLMLVCLLSMLVISAAQWLQAFLDPLLNVFGRIGVGIRRLMTVWREMTIFYASNSRNIIWALLLCLPTHLIWLGIVYAFAALQDMPVDFLTLSAASTIVWVIAALPVSIGGLGVRELSFVYLLSIQGVQPESATVLSLQQFGLQVIMGLLGIPFIWAMRREQS